MTSQIPKITIHIGFPKSGTTTLQRHLFSKHRQIFYLGKYVSSGGVNPDYSYRDSNTQKLVSNICGRDSTSPDFEFCTNFVREKITPQLKQGRIPLLSREGLSDSKGKVERRAQNIRTVFGDCRILVVLREPISRCNSLYIMHLQRHNVRKGLWGRRPYYISFKQWLDKYSQNVDLGYPLDTLQIYEDIFGKENLGIFLFEQLVEDPEAYCHQLCKFIGVDEQEGWNVSQGQWENKGWTEKHIDRLKGIQGSSWQSFCFRWMSLAKRSQYLCRTEPDDSQPHIMMQEHQAPLRDLYRPVFRKVKERWDLPLEQFGYPV